MKQTVDCTPLDAVSEDRRPGIRKLAKSIAAEHPKWPQHRVLSEAKMRYTERRYLQFDPFEGDRDADIRNHTVKMRTTRKIHRCAMPTGPAQQQHEIPAGSRVRFESAIVDNEWGAYYVCLPCIDAWLNETGAAP